jgi:fatty acid desaturase
MTKSSRLNFERELAFEKRLRKQKWLIPTLTGLTAVALAGGMYCCMLAFDVGYWWTFFPAGILMHSFLIITMHEAAHKSITRTRADRIILNAAAATMLLPMVGEMFRKYHLMHHANTNTHVDPLWPPVKKELYEGKRWFYILCEGVPLLFTLYLILKSDSNKKQKQVEVKSPKISALNIVWAAAISVLLAWYLQPSIWFFLGCLLGLNVMSTLRHWCEHLGTKTDRESNTYWFPLGMGIGNHETHHYHAKLSWFTLMVGLFYRSRETNPLKALWGVIFKKDFGHYKSR